MRLGGRIGGVTQGRNHTPRCSLSAPDLPASAPSKISRRLRVAELNSPGASDLLAGCTLHADGDTQHRHAEVPGRKACAGSTPDPLSRVAFPIWKDRGDRPYLKNPITSLSPFIRHIGIPKGPLSHVRQLFIGAPKTPIRIAWLNRYRQVGEHPPMRRPSQRPGLY